MKKLVLIIGLLVSSGFAQIEPCEDYICDSLALRTILDSNDRADLSVKDISSRINNRITSLAMFNLDLTVLPPEIGKLTAVNTMNIASSLLTGIPPEMGQLVNLENLLLEFNQLKNLPSEIGNLTSLTSLYLGSNPLERLPASIINLTELTRLGLSHTNMNTVPPQIFAFTKLNFLSLNNNELTVLPPEINTFTEMEHLILAFNNLTSLPTEITELDSLKKLHIGYNELQDLPTGLIQLELTFLNVLKNRLCSLPDSVYDWVNTFSSDSNWEETQFADETHYCDGSEVSVNHPINSNDELTIQYEPVTQNIIISMKEELKGSLINIYNIKGIMVANFNALSKNVIWNAKEQRRGGYLLGLLKDNKQIVRKFVLD